jgi:crotonobetainyl-CoA:carnitine CoA-transferase CaiB-like acyl-CoA transferase
MADWGADVIKVEPSTGDPQRAVFGAVGVNSDLPVPPFEVDNRGKRSVVLDLRTADHVAVLHDLLEDADVLVTNMRQAALQRLGFGHAAVCARHPNLVYGAITGYGLDGVDADRAGYDTGAFWARSGFAHTMVPPGEMPPNLRSGTGDHFTGMTLAAGVMAKLVERSTTGKGGLVSTSLLRTGMYAIAWDMGIQLRFGRRQRTRARENNPSPLVNNYPTADGRSIWLICLEADRHWPKVLTAIDRLDLADDERFISAKSRMENCTPLIAEFDAVFATRTLDEWGAIFDANDVWWAPVQSIVDVIEDPQAQPGFVDMSPRDGEEPYRAVRTPVDFEGFEMPAGAVPRLGEHTEEILGDLDATKH